jgi:hypothetical protein
MRGLRPGAALAPQAVGSRGFGLFIITKLLYLRHISINVETILWEEGY